MIEKDDLELILLEHVDNDLRDIIMSKQLKSICKNGYKTNIIKILKLLEQKKLLYVLKFCVTILEIKYDNIKNNIDALEQNNLLYLVDKCPSILKSTKNNLGKIIEILKKYDLIEILDKCPIILIRGNKNNVEKNIEILQKYNLLYLVYQCPIMLTQVPNKMENIIKLLVKKDMVYLIIKCPSILLYGDDKLILSYLDKAIDNNIIADIVECSSLLFTKNLDKIDSIIDKKNHIKTINRRS